MKDLLNRIPVVADLAFLLIVMGATVGFFVGRLPSDKFFELVMLAAGAYYGALRPGSKADRQTPPNPQAPQ